jgi:hypothetical protein
VDHRAGRTDPTVRHRLSGSKARRTIKELDTVALNRDVADYGLATGDLGTVVHVYADGKAFEVEFTTLAGDTLGVVTLEAGDIRPIHGREIAHARAVA